MGSGCSPRDSQTLSKEKSISLSFSRTTPPLAELAFSTGAPRKDILLEIFNGTFQHRQHKPFLALADVFLVHSLHDHIVRRSLETHPSVTRRWLYVAFLSIDSPAFSFCASLHDQINLSINVLAKLRTYHSAASFESNFSAGPCTSKHRNVLPLLYWT
jgi:hypothetical protein